ncbi:30S ribosomal protein S20 [Candidatus Omnitrophota bacterium]
MANKKAAIKALRQDKKKHDRNKAVMSELRTLAKKARNLINEKNREEADAALKTLESKLYRAAKTNLIKKNNASRRISRMRSSWSKIGA